ncbi:unnamed protein product [Rhodiola kirilowii]
MTERLSLRRRLKTDNDRRKRPPHPSPSTSRGNSSSWRTPEKSTKPVRSFKRCASAPALFGVLEESAVSEEDRASFDCDKGVLTHAKTCWDVLSTSAPSNLGQSFRIYEERCYDKEAKVVVNVTVEGSPGPIRTMVQLGSSVEQTIKLIMEKYDKEGRRPTLNKNDDGVSFELHDSYFSLQCLAKSDVIGDIGSRSFYLRTSRKASRPSRTEPGITSAVSSLTISEVIATRSAAADPTLHPSFLFLSGFISRRISQFMRRTRKLWKILGCMQSESG